MACAVSCLNICKTSALSDNMCPRVLFMGMPVDYKKKLMVVFGDYVEVYEGTDNTSRARSSACIVLYPVSNASGSWVLQKIESRCRVRRTNTVKLVNSNLITQSMNADSEETTNEEMLQ